MTWFDYGVLSVLGLSLLLGALRGLTREIVSLAGWIAAFVLATAFSGIVAVQMPESLGPLLSGLLAFLLIFVGVLVLSGVVGLVLSLLVRAAGLGFLDRLLGAAFGAVRGVAIVLLAVFGVGVFLTGLELMITAVALPSIIVHFSERIYGAFERSFTLPATIDGTKIVAKFESGLLTILLPKVEAAKRHHAHGNALLA